MNSLKVSENSLEVDYFCFLLQTVIEKTQSIPFSYAANHTPKIVPESFGKSIVHVEVDGVVSKGKTEAAVIKEREDRLCERTKQDPDIIVDVNHCPWRVDHDEADGDDKHHSCEDSVQLRRSACYLCRHHDLPPFCASSELKSGQAWEDHYKSPWDETVDQIVYHIQVKNHVATVVMDTVVEAAPSKRDGADDEGHDGG